MADQHKSADRFGECLKAKGIPFSDELGTLGGHGEAEFRWIVPRPDIEPWLANIPGIGGTFSSAAEADELSRRQNEVLLVVGGVDKSDQLSECLDKSGYIIPKPVFDEQEEAKVKQGMAEASNRWAACVRENGLPGVVDVKPEVDSWETRPEVVVPGDTDVNVFKAALSKCPPFDPDRDLTVGQTDPRQEKWVDPIITFGPTENQPNAEKLDAALVDYNIEMYDKARGGK